MDYVSLIKSLIPTATAADPVNSSSKHFFDHELFWRIRPQIAAVAAIYQLPEVDEITLHKYFETAKKWHLSVHPIDIGLSHSLTKKDFITWLTPERKEKINWNYTERYIRFLRESGRPEKVIDETVCSSLDIMEKLGDPESNDPFYAKGLVVGEVQSGKTGNFNAVINRALDSGYGLVIVLSGIMEDLRSQTQRRIESDVIGEGRDLATDKVGKKGVGHIHRFGPLGDNGVFQVKSITSPTADFSKAVKEAEFTLNDTNVLVCKKNVSVLRNLIVWLHDYLEDNHDKHNIPLLILDDEADNASLNNMGAKGRNYATKINGHIRALLALFNRKSYLGYTATPFANVLQDRNETPEGDCTVKYRVRGEATEKLLAQVDNIFPDDFIILLNPPSNYVGAKQVFETLIPLDNNEEGEKIPLAHIVDDQISEFPTRVYDNEEGDIVGVENFASREEWTNRFGEHGTYLDFNDYADYRRSTRGAKKDDDFPKDLPVSLKEAIMCFVISMAIRESRKPDMLDSKLYNPHNTMLIHVSRFTAWQNMTAGLISTYYAEMKNSISNDNPASKDSIYFEFEKIWYRYFAMIVKNIKGYLPRDYHDEFMTPIAWEAVRNYLPEVIRDIDIKAVNSYTKDKLEYHRNKPKRIIAVGGNRLSRGFTLEGLTINYFVRTTNYSDTLLQMGRWFGYRPGYLDCCKIFTTSDSIYKFNSTTRCIEELEGEFRKMERLRKEPRNFAIRVRKHPGALKITRPSILKNAREVKWSYEDQLVQTTEFEMTMRQIGSVWENFKTNVAPKFSNPQERDDFMIFQTDGAGILALLDQPNNFAPDELNQIRKFIELCVENGKLTEWTVALKTKGQSKSRLNSQFSGLSQDIELAIRRGPQMAATKYWNDFLNDKKFTASGKSVNIISAGSDFSLLITEAEKEKAEREFHKDRMEYYKKKDEKISEDEAREKAKKVSIPERVYRERIPEHQGLLVMYLFDAHHSFNQDKTDPKFEPFREFVKKENIDLNIPLVGYAIGFPPMENDPGGIYLQGDYDLDEDEGIEDPDDEEFNEILNEE